MSVELVDQSPAPQVSSPAQSMRSASRKMSKRQSLRALQPPDIYAACRQGDLAALRTALCNGMDPNTKSQGQTPLMYACENGYAECAKLLIANGAHVAAVDSYNRTALHLACQNSHVECAEVLMGAGAAVDVESTLGGETPADIVHMRGSIEMVRTVMYYGKNTNKTKDLETQQQQQQRQIKEDKPPEAPPAPSNAKQEPVKDDVDEGSLPSALSFPRRAPPPEVDELKRLHTPPRREPL